ncbi:helix-turn-helix transcriptional regulator [Microbacterium sp. W4I20]|uniref:helix-turn-helix domain-containing protein n=1 Tax=Microbacterium sp. W4I20 TaxID=3042262 RepID=UPI00278672C5|nr:helix-turn-helix transcriptional regulator [Microbacterium sp. W4I20]MDQ0727943.1 DNA-binding XRE family transcriptional regulator [Microbacterium sp. W4I20]
MPLRFRNIDATPDDPVREWGFEGMLAAIDRGYATDWRKLIAAVLSEPELRPVFEEAREAAESRSTVALLDAVLERAERSPSEQALARLRSAYRGTRMTQAELARRLGTSRTRLNSYLTGKVTPAMDVLVAVEQIAERHRAPARAHNLVLD